MNALIVTTWGKHGSRVEGGRHCLGFRRMMIMKIDDEIFKDKEDQEEGKVILTIQETFIEVAAEGSSTEKFIATKVYDVEKDDENGGEGDVGVRRWGNTLRA